MIRRLLDLPLPVVLMAIGALAMLVPALHAVALRDYSVARAFAYSSGLFLVLTAMIALDTAANRPGDAARSQLVALVAAYAGLPLMLAVPMREAVPDSTYLAAWWEMVSSLTTTGATVFDPDSLPPSVHLWRALVGWLGGLFTLVAAMAILAPLNLGGFEVLTTGGGQGIGRMSDPGGRVLQAATAVLPVYLALTLVLWGALIGAGDPALIAASHAMGAISTSGITPQGGPDSAPSGLLGECVIALFLVPALTRRLIGAGRLVLSTRTGGGMDVGRGGYRALRELWHDRELRLGLALVAVVSLLLFLRHWIGAIEGRSQIDLRSAAGALWGAVFTVLSFLTTTGFVSAEWGASRLWSGLGSPGLILAGLAIIGGGIATTAGGVKLLRMVALYGHGRRELEKLVHPASLGGGGQEARRMRRHGAQIAWVAFMLFAVAIAGTMLLLTFFGTGFQEAMVFSIAALSTTGPLADVAGDVPLAWSGLGGIERAVLAAAMVVGRLETLAVIALFNPALWRN